MAMATNSRSGALRVNLGGTSASYRSFVPTPLPPQPALVVDADLLNLAVQANVALARLDAIAADTPDLNPLLAMTVRKEAVLSSQIEGTQATLEDVLDPTSKNNANREVADVVNYVHAIHFALERIQTLPLSARLLRETHAVLMDGVRGQERSPGEFRTSQNWIGAAGLTLNEALFVPPNPADMLAAMGELEAFMNADTALDPLIAAALIHYQFETIHPFLDGNGRIGRLLVTLFLMGRGVLQQPALYLSYYLKVHRTEYYDRMMEVRVSGDYEQWVRFFLRAIAESGAVALAALERMRALRERNTKELATLGRSSRHALRLLAQLESTPIVTASGVAASLGVSFRTASLLLARLVDAGVLVQRGEGSRNRLFAYAEYLQILDNEVG